MVHGVVQRLPLLLVHRAALVEAVDEGALLAEDRHGGAVRLRYEVGDREGEWKVGWMQREGGCSSAGQGCTAQRQQQRKRTCTARYWAGASASRSWMKV